MTTSRGRARPRRNTMTVDVGLREPPQVSGGQGEHGHLEELRVDPIALMRRVRDECGDVGQFRLADRDVVLLTGAEANELFFRAPEEVLDQAEAYPFMTPIFGEGVVFDAPPNGGARCSTTRPCVTSSCGATRRRSPRRSKPWWAAGLTRARSTSWTGSRSSPSTRPRRASSGASSATSSTAASPSSTTTSSRAPTPSPMSTRTRPSRASAAATRPGSGSWPWSRGSWTAAARARPPPTRTATCSTC